MRALVLHPRTQTALESLINKPGHAILIDGPAGSGKGSVATTLIAAVLSLSSDKLATYPYLHHTKSEQAKPIGIEAIRELEQFLTLKVPVDYPYNRAVLIENGDKLTLEAQNALLKTLEEPPVGTLIVISATHTQALLPTVRSRVQSLSVQSPPHAALHTYFSDQGFPTSKIVQTLAMAGGLPGLATALLNEADHPLQAAATEARAMLSSSSFERLALVDRLTKDRETTLQVLYLMQQMARLSLQTATGKAAERWQAILIAAFEASDALQHNVQAKLVLTNLSLSL